MAQRPVFIPTTTGETLVVEKSITFTWHPGFALSQAQKSIRALHASAAKALDVPILEISTRSPDPLGVALSAFNLALRDDHGRLLTVESAFQGSKVFEGNKQYTDLYEKDANEAKTDERLKQSGSLIKFRFEDQDWSLDPQTAFYDWLYLRALTQNDAVARQLLDYAAFTDIMFNPKKSINCQARAAALYVSLSHRNLLQEALSDRQNYLDLLTAPERPVQPRLLD